MKPEIDEAAAVEYHEWYSKDGSSSGNASRAALAWKARAEAAEAGRDSLRRQLAQSVKAR